MAAIMLQTFKFSKYRKHSMSAEAELLKAIYDELKVIKEELKKLSSKIELIETGLIPEEEISEEEARELERLAEETKKDGIPWDKLKAELDL
ncbi:hypothetical protein GACE_0291 [Geoglobus acetivorans]|uniref:Uncharacterized protein n=2 Tax=Geoglobus acetivorans TaxID=565033 RepID=A0A0A7GEL1_GEOAI|nr:hypothetical protein GACE_0291 [Geoglobus acetivorans]